MCYYSEAYLVPFWPSKIEQRLWAVNYFCKKILDIWQGSEDVSGISVKLSGIAFLTNWFLFSHICIISKEDWVCIELLFQNLYDRVIWFFFSFHLNWYSGQQTSQVRGLFRIVRNCYNAAAAIWSCYAFRRTQKAKVGSKKNWGGKHSQAIRNIWRNCSVSRYPKRN